MFVASDPIVNPRGWDSRGLLLQGPQSISWFLFSQYPSNPGDASKVKWMKGNQSVWQLLSDIFRHEKWLNQETEGTMKTIIGHIVLQNFGNKERGLGMNSRVY